MKKIFILLAALSVMLIAGHAMATDTPTSHQGITVVDADWVKANVGKVMVFDARKKGEVGYPLDSAYHYCLCLP